MEPTLIPAPRGTAGGYLGVQVSESLSKFFKKVFEKRTGENPPGHLVKPLWSTCQGKPAPSQEPREPERVTGPLFSSEQEPNALLHKVSGASYPGKNKGK